METIVVQQSMVERMYVAFIFGLIKVFSFIIIRIIKTIMCDVFGSYKILLNSC